jgi:lipoprotein-releasing system permease protein
MVYVPSTICFGFDLRKSFELYIASRYLKARRKQTIISFISFIAISGVALGVAALIVVLAVMTGMEEDIKERILGTRSHIIISKFQGFGSKSLVPDKVIFDKILSVPGVLGVAPYILKQIMIRADQVQGIMIRGIDPVMEKNVSTLKETMILGDINNLNSDEKGDSTAGILIGSELADTIGARNIGSEIYLISPYSSRLTPAGEVPRMKKFKLAGIFKSGYYEWDSSLAYIDLKSAQRFFGMGDSISGIEVRIRDIYKVKKIAAEITRKLGDEFYTTDWMEMNRNLFSALKLEKWAMFIVLLFLIVIAAFNIITTLIMMVMEKNRDIGIMRSMGATKRSIMKIFILQGMIIGFIGTISGLILGISISYICDTYKLIRLPLDVYYIAYLPFRMLPGEIVLITISSLLICFLSTIYPSLKASRLDPVEAIRYE